jgi:hypothetical protein
MQPTKAAQILKADRQFKGGAAVARTHQARKHVRYLGIEVDETLRISEQIEL